MPASSYGLIEHWRVLEELPLECRNREADGRKAAKRRQSLLEVHFRIRVGTNCQKLMVFYLN